MVVELTAEYEYLHVSDDSDATLYSMDKASVRYTR